MKFKLRNLNIHFDHAALKPDVTEQAITKLCNEAIEYNFFAVAVNPFWVRTAAEIVQGTNVKVVSVAGFPLGANRTDIKKDEAARAVSDGADEIDMVANIGWLKSGEFTKVEQEIKEIRKSVPFNVLLKVIIECSLLTKPEQISAAKAVINGGAQFVKTSTGFSGGVTLEQVKILFEAVSGQIEVKASGGIKTAGQCQELIECGASRLGSSSSVAIVQELQRLT
ncbi:MAG: deoxyribose-phosphate aldolase [candidate division Zixibacteria bacterium]|nr:deoxyribose-phosphate aldolase [candidate division Zixibacteria bacterium]